MSGTKPYMAPEVFECVADACEGYGYGVDWWSLGVTAYEVRRGKRPFDIHSNTSLQEIRLMFGQTPTFPSSCHPGLVHLISRLLTVSAEKRIRCLEELVQLPYAAAVSLDDVIHKRIKPAFTPPKDHLNCDPTFELEEMIIESRPLHKKKKRLSKQKSIRETQSSISGTTEGEAVVYERMLVFNREQVQAKRARERREAEWQAELEESMKMSDPTGHGCNFAGSNTATPVKQRSRSYKEPIERRHKEDLQEAAAARAISSPSTACSSSASSLLPASPTDRSTLPKIAVSPSNVKARIAGSPKVKVRGTTVTIESPRSSSSLTKSSTQQLKERLKELKADQHRHGDSGSETEYSGMTQSDDLTLSGRRSPSRSPDRSQRRSASKSPDRPQRRSASGSPKRSSRRSTSGSCRRSPGRSSRKLAGKSPKKGAQKSSSVPQEVEAKETTSTSLEKLPQDASFAQESSRSENKGIARPVSLPAAVCHEFQQFSNLRISAPPEISSSKHSNSHESSISTKDQNILEATDVSKHNPPTEETQRMVNDPLKSVLTNGSLTSTQILSKSPVVQGLTLEDKGSEAKEDNQLERRRRHSMEPLRKSIDRSKRFSESHRSSSVTGKMGTQSWRTSFEIQRNVSEAGSKATDVLKRSSLPSKRNPDNWNYSPDVRKRCSLPSKRDPDNWRNSFELEKNAPEPKVTVPEIPKNAAETGSVSCDITKRPSFRNKRDPDGWSNSADVRKRASLPCKKDPDSWSNLPDVRKRCSLPSKRDPDNWRKSLEIQRDASIKAKHSPEYGTTPPGVRKSLCETGHRESSENLNKACEKSSESLRQSFGESKSRNSSITRKASIEGVNNDQLRTSNTAPEVSKEQTIKPPSASHEPGNDNTDEGIELSC
nr:serine/arginine repetitive matrix protein 1-like [Procambarus clarkii]